MRATFRFALLLLVVAVAASLAASASSRAWLARQVGRLSATRSPPIASTVTEGEATTDRNQPSASFAAVAEAAKPAVVNVVARQKIVLPPSLGLSPDHREGPDGDAEAFEAPGEPPVPPGESTRLQLENLASGFAVRDDGTIVTSNRAIEHAERVTVRFAGDPNPHDARVVGTDPVTDLALLKVSDAGTTRSLTFAEPGTTRAGDWVVAIGNPFGLEQTLTAGIISATDRAVGNGFSGDFLQVNASLNPGDSGGPLLNVDGEVVGITSGAFRQGSGSVGIAFALPADAVKRVIEQLEENGRVIRPWLGVTVQDLNADLAKALGVEERAGLVVSEVEAEGPAAAAGIERGDVIVSYGADETRLARDLQRGIAATPVGSGVEINVIRDGKPLKLAAKLAEMPDRRDRLEQAPQQLSMGGGEQDGTGERIRR